MLAAPPDEKGNHNRARESEPGDGVLQVVVLEMHLQRTGFRNAVRRRRLFEVDVEWRNRFAASAPTERVSHRQMVACEPEPLLDIDRRRKNASAFRKADIADEIGRFTSTKVRYCAILL